MEKEKVYRIIGLFLALTILFVSLSSGPTLVNYSFNASISVLAIIAFIGIAVKRKEGNYILALAFALLILGSFVTFTQLVIKDLPIENISKEPLMPERPGVRVITPWTGKFEKAAMFLIVGIAGAIIAFKTKRFEEAKKLIKKKIGFKKFLVSFLLIFGIVFFYFISPSLAMDQSLRGNPSLCVFAEYPEGCVLGSAITSEDETKCDLIEGEAKTDCIYWVAMTKGDIKLCEQFAPGEDYYDACYWGLAGILEKPELCQKVSGGEEECLQSYYFETGECEKLNDADKKDFCYKNLARETEDKSYCEEITDEWIKDSCINPRDPFTNWSELEN